MPLDMDVAGLVVRIIRHSFAVHNRTAGDLRSIQLFNHLIYCSFGNPTPQQGVKLDAFHAVYIGAGLLPFLLLRIEVQDPTHPGKHRQADCTDHNPAITGLERIVRLKRSSLVARSLADEAMTEILDHRA